MNIYVVSRRSLVSSVAWDTVFQLENLIAEVCGATIVTPRATPLYRALMPPGRRWVPGLRRLIPAFETVELPERKGPEVLLLLAISAPGLDLLNAIPNWRARFDTVAAYLFDCWGWYPSVARKLDHLFVPLPEPIEDLRRRIRVPVTLLPFGVDALQQGSASPERPIDILSYGRIPEKYHRALAERFHRVDSRRLYLRLVPRPMRRYPQAPYEQRNDRFDPELLFHLLRRAAISLCFDTTYPGMRQFPFSFVTLRWFDAIATGCAIVGKRPSTSEADRLLNWQDATIEVPEDPLKAADFIDELLDDKPRLAALRLRNHHHALARHDWRLRLLDIFKSLGIETPAPLAAELLLLSKRAHNIPGEDAAGDSFSE